MPNTAEKTAKTVAKKATKAREQKKCSCENCEQGKNCGQRIPAILPLCCFFAMMTAILIAIALAITFSAIARNYEYLSAANYAGSFRNALSESDENAAELANLDAAAVIDWLANTKSSGFLFVSSNRCGSRCTAYAEKLENLIAESAKSAASTEAAAGSDDADAKDGLIIYRFEAGSTSDRDYDRALATKFALGDADAPALLFIKDGQIYDRVDNLDDASTESFLKKYQ